MTPQELINYLKDFLEENPGSWNNHIAFVTSISVPFAKAIVETNSTGSQIMSLSLSVEPGGVAGKRIIFRGV